MTPMSRKTPEAARTTASHAVGGDSSADEKPGSQKCTSLGLIAAQDSASRSCLQSVEAEKFVEQLCTVEFSSSSIVLAFATTPRTCGFPKDHYMMWIASEG